MSLEHISEIPPASSLCLKPSKLLILMICLLLMDVSEPGGLIEDVGGVAKEIVSVLTFSEKLGTVPEIAIWQLQSTFFLFGLGISFLRPSLSFKKVRKHKGTD